MTDYAGDLSQLDDLSRRSFLKLLGASVALAGLDGCTRMPGEHILPWAHQPPELTPGVPLHYATSMSIDGYATGLIVEAHEGRPTKIEGNPIHPASLGATGVLEQASLLQLYDPDRARFVRDGRARSTWEQFVARFAPASLRERVGADGAGLALLLQPTSSSVVAELAVRLRTLYPRAGIYFDAPGMPQPLEQALIVPRGTAPVARFDLSQAEVILTVGSDLLANGPFTLHYARQFADARRQPLAKMNRLYAIESSVTVTGAAADHRLRCRPARTEMMVAWLHDLLTADSAASTRAVDMLSSDLDERERAWLGAVADDLRAHPRRGLVVAGDAETPRTHALVTAINEALGNVGWTVWFTRTPLSGYPTAGFDLPALATATRDGGVDTLIIVGGNPVYGAHPSGAFNGVASRVREIAYLGMYENETAAAAQWFVPAAHYLETWDDAVALDGIRSPVQPLVKPIFGGRSDVDVLAALAGAHEDPYTLLRESWRHLGIATDDASWRSIITSGVVPGPILPPLLARPRPELIASRAATKPPAGSVDVAFRCDSRVHDGSFANNGWLQELPEPITKLTWDNAAEVSPATAGRLGVDDGEVIELSAGGRTLRAPCLVVPGHADDAVTLSLGYGRRGAEHTASGVGVDVSSLRPADGSALVLGAIVARATGAPRHAFAITQGHWTMEGRDPARTATLAAYQAHPESVGTKRRQPLTVYENAPKLDAPQQWAMTIDLGLCTGCSACVVACQSENNIPIVGREDVAKSREMHWLRIDRYREGSIDDPSFVTQPMLCQHCEHAPCEYVCPVGATDHSPEGLNEMVYNRCVGTRFCSNNCPYKVRRFNWFDYNAELAETERMARNPDVTVRERGVMEKCTFCVQRIREAEIAAGVAGEPMRGSSVRTACQQACPTRAITFGSLTEGDSEMLSARAEPRAYDVLGELGTAPRVKYLARIRNPNPALDKLA
jgi:molybdopterin-containing oxidoreductase family iron-sulfur binding subunit